jgi:predicted AlkP superfamily phosphohydrolase/phosphomutase
LVSDHGFGPVNRTFHSNAWLESQGFRVPADTSLVESLRSRYFPYLRAVAEPIVAAVPQLNDVARSVGERIRGSLTDDVDWERSIAVAPRQNLTCGMLYLLSDDPDDEAAVVDALERLETPEGRPLDVEVYRPEDLYDGPKVELAPDILFTVENFACAVDPRDVTAERVTEGPPAPARSGGHRMEGLYVAAGAGVDGDAEGLPTGTAADASLLDIAPTLLYAMDAPIPTEMDGAPMDLFAPEMTEHRTERRRPLAELVTSAESTGERDTEAVQDRLEDLGYI